MQVKKELFGFIDGQPITLFTVKNENGFELSCINYGCIITKILASDRDGKIENTVLGFDTIEEYDKNPHFLGAIIGRFSGRIKNGAFNLNGNDYEVTKNEGKNHLHGGNKGFSRILWDSKVIEKEDEIIIEFTYLSPDGEEGYPGNLEMKVNYIINRNKNEFTINYSGISDKKTLLNVTSHTYFNLSGDLKRDILDHDLTIDSNEFIELNDELLPTGNLVPVDHSVFDFRKERRICEGVNSNHQQSVLAEKGYDHPFILGANQQGLILLVDHESGRKLEIETTEPTVVLYTGNKLDDTYLIRGVKSRNYLGLCLETQRPPDSINHPHFHSALLNEGEEYRTETRYSFGIV